MLVKFFYSLREYANDDHPDNYLRVVQLERTIDMTIPPLVGMMVLFESNWPCPNGDPLNYVIEDLLYDAVKRVVECFTTSADAFRAHCINDAGMLDRYLATMLAKGWIITPEEET